MTREEAIYLLRNTAWLAPSENYELVEEAVRMATKALRERPNGKWKRKLGTLYCSVCGNSWSVSFEHLLNKFNYCPNCGADMRSKIVGKHADFMMIDEAVAKGADDED